MFNKPVKPMSGNAQSSRIGRLLFFLMLVMLVVVWLFPNLGFVGRMISLFVSLMFIALGALVTVDWLLPGWTERLLTSQKQNPSDPENLQQDDRP